MHLDKRDKYIFIYLLYLLLFFVFDRQHQVWA